jgi:hypothetical protein
VDGERVWKELDEVNLKEWRGEGGRVMWDEGDEDVLDDSEMSEEEVTKRGIRLFSKLALGSYGGMGMIFFGALFFRPSLPSRRADVSHQTPGVKLPPGATTCETPHSPAEASPELDALITEFGYDHLPDEFPPSICEEMSKNQFGFWGLLNGTQFVLSHSPSFYPHS